MSFVRFGVAAACAVLLLGSGPVVSAATQPSISLRPDSAPVEGGPGASNSVAYNVVLSAPSSVAVTVDFTSENGFASGCRVRSAECDFLHVNGRLTFAPGETLKRVLIPVIGDSTPEDHETLSLLLTNPVNATVPLSRAISAILNDDAPIISVRAAPAQLEGGANQFNSIAYRISLSGRFLSNVTLDVATEDGTAFGCLGTGVGCDYQQVRGTVTFIPGEVEKTLVVPVYGDTQIEPDETLSLLLSNPVNGVLSASPVTSTIRNDD